jgi:DNA repair protein RecO
VIWEKKTGEADRVITLLTPSGVVSAYAKNSLRPKNKLTSPTAMLSYSNFELFSGKNMFTVDDATIKHRFVKLFSDVQGYALAAYLCELLKLLAPVDDDAGDFMSLALNSLYLINDGKKDRDIIKSVFELRIAAFAGYMPDLAECRECGEYQSDSAWFDVQEGTWLCRNCAVQNARPINLPGAVLAAMRHIIYSDADKAFSFELGEQSRKQLCSICEQYIITRLERGLQTLDFYKTIST